MRYPLVQRGLIALVQVLVMGVWFSASAVVPALARRWRISAGSAAWLPPRRCRPGSWPGPSARPCLAWPTGCGRICSSRGAPRAAGCTLVMALFADGPFAAVPLRFATGASCAGVYPVGIKLMASWSRPAGRALAMGVLIGALTLGSALPHLIGGLWRLDWRAVLAASAAIAFAGAIMAGVLIRPGPQVPLAGRAGRPRSALAMFADRGPRLVSLAYFGHMWELYALWTWLLPAFLAASSTAPPARRPQPSPASTPSS